MHNELWVAKILLGYLFANHCHFLHLINLNKNHTMQGNIEPKLKFSHNMQTIYKDKHIKVHIWG